MEVKKIVATTLKRLNIFKYFEDINMLLPVETFHDTDKNVVYTTTDCLGTYCLIDMEVWLDSLGISSTFGKTEVEESGAMSENSVDNDNYMCYTVNELEAKSNDSKYKNNLNVVFVIDTRIASDKLEETKEKILDISRTVLKHSPDSRIYIFEQNTDMSTDKGYKVYSAKGNRFFTDYNTLAETLKEVASSGTTEDSAILSDAVGGIISVCDLSRETYAFSLFSQEGVIYRTENGYDFLDSAIGKNVDISVIAKIDDSLVYGYAHDMYKKSGGIILSDTTDYAEDVLNHIYGKKVNKEEEDTGKYQMILATGLTTVELKAPITPEYAELAKLDEIDETQPDTDEDGLPDYKEINFNVKGADGKPLIEFINGIVDLPKYGECIDIKSELTYVERGFNRFDDVVINDIAFLNYVYDTVDVLPIVSDPTYEDGDGDGVPDKYDYNMLCVLDTDSCCWLYKNNYYETYCYLYGKSDWDNYSDNNVKNHNLSVVIYEKDEFGRNMPFYCCSEECCSEDENGCQVKFLSPDYEDMYMCSNYGHYSEAKYVLLNQLKAAYLYYSLVDDEYSMKRAEAVYHIIDDLRIQNETEGYRYQFGDENGYVSPAEYKYKKEELKNIKIIVNLSYRDVPADELKNIIINHGYGLLFPILGSDNSCTFGGTLVTNLLTEYDLIDDGTAENNSKISLFLDDSCSVLTMGIIKNESIIKSLKIDRVNNYNNLKLNKQIITQNRMKKATGLYSKASLIFNVATAFYDCYKWFNEWNYSIYYDEYTISITVSSNENITDYIVSQSMFAELGLPIYPTNNKIYNRIYSDNSSFTLNGGTYNINTNTPELYMLNVKTSEFIR